MSDPTELLLGEPLVPQSQFQPGVPTGCCGQNALRTAIDNAPDAASTPVNLLAVYQYMQGAGLCDPNGATRIDQLRAAAAHFGLRETFYRPYAEPWDPADALSHIAAGLRWEHASALYETANGQAIRDELTGAGENATNLHYHYVLVVGKHNGGHSDYAGRDLPPGLWIADGDSLAQGTSGRLTFITLDTFAASRPCAMLQFVGQPLRELAPPPPPPPPPPAPDPRDVTIARQTALIGQLTDTLAAYQKDDDTLAALAADFQRVATQAAALLAAKAGN